MSNQLVNIPTVNGQHHVGNPGESNGPQNLSEPLLCDQGLVNPEETIKQIQELIKENNELKEAMKQTNHAMKDRFEELSSWREKQREERAFLENKFREAKECTLALTAENEELKKKLQALGEKPQTACQGGPNGGSVSMEVEDQEVEVLKALTLRLQAEKADLVAMISELQLKLGALSSEDSFVEIGMMNGEETGELRVTKDSPDTATGQTEAHSRAKFVEEAKKHMGSEELTVSHLLHLLHEGSQNVEKLQQDLRAANDRVSYLEKKASELSENGTQTEWTEEDQTQEAEVPAADASQLTSEVEELKAQVTSLLKELQESHARLNDAEQLKKALQEKCQALERKARENQSEAEEKQLLQYANEKLVLQVESMQSEIKMEQNKTADEKRKLAQLQLAYDHLSNDSDKMINQLKSTQAESEQNFKSMVNDLHAKLELAEKALAKKQIQIDEMTQAIAKHEEEMDTVSLMKAQMEVYCADFHAERAAREKIHEEKERLGIQLEYLVKENSKLKQDLNNLGRQSLAHMQQRHGAVGGGHQDPGPRIAHRGADNRDWQHQVNIPEHACPKCGEILPDIDTLQIHVMDCII